MLLLLLSGSFVEAAASYASETAADSFVPETAADSSVPETAADSFVPEMAADSSVSQTAEVSASDRQCLQQIRQRSRDNGWTKASRTDSLAAFFLNTPYVAATLEHPDGEERVVVNLRQLDCLTLVENVVCLQAWLDSLSQPGHPYVSEALQTALYVRLLESVRYRGGQCRGYVSRLHYTSEWIADNRQKGFVTDLTDRFSPQPYRPDVHYMSQHPESYPALRGRPERIRALAAVEAEVNRLCLEYIPKNQLGRWESQIPSGCIAAIVTSAEGLDIGHLGFTVRQDGQLHLLHASSTAGRVVVSEKTLVEYLQGIHRFTGLILLSVN